MEKSRTLMSNIPNNTISIDKKGNLIYTAKIYDFIDNEFFTCIVLMSI